ncbi:HAD family acid phosphatase [Opitutaceae bacterium]
MARHSVLSAFISIGAFLLAGCATTAPATLVNLTDAKAAVVAYVDSGGYERDLAAVAAQARSWVEQRAARRAPGERLAVVFDIDETVLSSYPQMKDQDFGYVAEVWNDWVDRGVAPAIGPVRAVYRTARERGVDVFFVTGRQDPRDRAGTEANLRREGMGDYARLVLAPESDDFATTAERKAAQRAALAREGWTIIASVGDQESDLTGGHAERTFKLPNPFYAIP